MKFKKSILFICIIIFLFCLAGVNAKDINNASLTNDENFQLLEDSNEEIINSSQNDIIGTDDDGTFTSLQKIIDDASQGSIINLDKDYTYDEGFDKKGIIINKDITINGNGHSLDGLSKSRILLVKFSLFENNKVTLNNIKFKNGYTNYYGGAIFNYANLTVNNCEFTDNFAQCCGGAINSVGNLKCSNSIFNGNTANGDAGAIFCLSFHESVYFYPNYYRNATVIGDMEFVLPLTMNMTLHFDTDYITGCTFTNNVANGRGGGAVYAYSHLNVDSCNFNSNKAGQIGGAIFANKDLFVKNSVFTNNQAKKNGGAIYFRSHEITSKHQDGKWVSLTNHFTSLIESSTFTKNIADNGGAIYSFIDSKTDKTHWAKAVKCTFEANKASSNRDVYGTVTSNCLFNYLKLTLKSVKIKKSAKKLVLTATLKKGNTLLKNKKITFKFNGKTYKAKTNKNGIAKVIIKKAVLKKLKVGKKIKYQAKYSSITVKKTAKVKK